MPSLAGGLVQSADNYGDAAEGSLCVGATGGEAGDREGCLLAAKEPTPFRRNGPVNCPLHADSRLFVFVGR